MQKTNRPTIIRTYDKKADTLTCENVGITALKGDTPQRFVTVIFTGVSLVSDQGKWDAIGAQWAIEAATPIRKAGDDFLTKNKVIRIAASTPGAKIESPETRRVAVDRAVASCQTAEEAERTYLAFKQRHEQLLATEKVNK